MGIELSQREKDLLNAILRKELEDVRSEFHHTQAFEYKESLKEREAAVRGLLDKLTA
jgi:hypothetical protein